MGLIDDIKAKVDANGDGTFNTADLESLKDTLPTEKFEELQAKLQEVGGKMNFDDIKTGFTDVFDNVAGSVGDFFKK